MYLKNNCIRNMYTNISICIKPNTILYAKQIILNNLIYDEMINTSMTFHKNFQIN